jgi:hypothetical protein
MTPSRRRMILWSAIGLVGVGAAGVCLAPASGTGGSARGGGRTAFGHGGCRGRHAGRGRVHCLCAGRRTFAAHSPQRRRLADCRGVGGGDAGTLRSRIARPARPGREPAGAAGRGSRAGACTPRSWSAPKRAGVCRGGTWPCPGAVRRGSVPRRFVDEAETLGTHGGRHRGRGDRSRGCREHDVLRARARLVTPVQGAPDGEDCECVTLTAPIDGVVLRVFEKSETVVTAGTPLLEVGDPAALEVVADFLSADAVRIRAGQTAWLDGWGGDQSISRPASAGSSRSASPRCRPSASRNSA